MDWLLYFLVALLWPSPAPAAPPGPPVTIPIDPLASDQQGPLPPVTAARGDNPPLVVIDAGHGGVDPGAASGDVLEKDVVLAVADEEREPVVIDWRAPVAEPFYRATGRNPMGLARRRHFATKGRQVLAL